MGGHRRQTRNFEAKKQPHGCCPLDVRPGSKKVIVSLQRDYLLAFASSSTLFGKGCQEIYHGQIAAYYRALVKVSADKIGNIVPGKSAAWYRQQWDTASVQNPLLRLDRTVAMARSDDSFLILLFVGLLRYMRNRQSKI